MGIFLSAVCEKFVIRHGYCLAVIGVVGTGVLNVALKIFDEMGRIYSCMGVVW